MRLTATYNNLIIYSEITSEPSFEATYGLYKYIV